jgi:Domain of unknown function (DUF1844)
MSADDSGDVFKVTDRRRRQEPEDSPQPAASQSDSPPTPAPPGPPPGPPTERSLAGLFMMLASSAVVALGHAPDPLTGQRQIDLVQAADAIDLLLLLREKTEGHRSDGESQMLEELIYDLQLRYVQVTKQS